MLGLTEKAVDDTEKEMKRADNSCCDVVVCVEKHARLIFNDQGVVVVDGLHGRIQMSGPCSNSYYSFDYSLDKKKNTAGPNKDIHGRASSFNQVEKNEVTTNESDVVPLFQLTSLCIIFSTPSGPREWTQTKGWWRLSTCNPLGMQISIIFLNNEDTQVLCHCQLTRGSWVLLTRNVFLSWLPRAQQVSAT